MLLMRTECCIAQMIIAGAKSATLDAPSRLEFALAMRALSVLSQ
jgi:hypothetical protein